ncbi:unnamed protein product [Symbiodinium microadriaticum]|nr:unnamed protein product [Symbiodinium microadriaticum]
MAPWHKTSPLPAPPSAPWRSATLPAPPQKASAPSTPWPLQSPSLHSDGLPSFVDRVAGVLGPAAGSDVLPLEEYKSRLATIYSVHNPSNVSKIGYLLSKYKDQEQLLYQSVCSKYQIPSTWDGRQPLPSLPFATQVQPSETQHKDQAAQGSPVNGSAKPNAAIPPPWAREKATTLPRVDLSKSESKEADDDFFESEAALKALQILTQDMGEPTRLPKQLKPAPEVPSAKGMAKIDYFLLGEKTGFFSDEVEDVFGVLSDAESEDEVKDQGAIDLQEDEEKEKLPATAEPGVAEGKSPTEAQEKPKKDEEEKPEDGKADIREAEDVDQEEEREKSPILAQPVMPPESSELQKEELRKAEERQRRTRAPKRKLPEPKAASKASEATLASTQPPPAANPQRAEPPGNADDDDDDEVVVLSVSAGDKILNQENGKRKVSEQEAEEKQTKPSLEEMAAEEKDTGVAGIWATMGNCQLARYLCDLRLAHEVLGLSGPSLIFPKDPDRLVDQHRDYGHQRFRKHEQRDVRAGERCDCSGRSRGGFLVWLCSHEFDRPSYDFASVSLFTLHALPNSPVFFLALQWLMSILCLSVLSSVRLEQGMLQEADRQILNKEDSVNRGQDVEFDAGQNTSRSCNPGCMLMQQLLSPILLAPNSPRLRRIIIATFLVRGPGSMTFDIGGHFLAQIWISYGSGGRKLSLDNQGWLKSLRNKGCAARFGRDAQVDNCDDDDDDEAILVAMKMRRADASRSRGISCQATKGSREAFSGVCFGKQYRFPCVDCFEESGRIQGEEGGGHLETVWWADGIALVLDVSSVAAAATQESYSQSSDDEEDMNDAPGAADNGTAPKGERSVRDTLLGEIFQDLQDFSGTPGRATMKAVKHWQKETVGFEGSDNEWRDEYLSLCKEWKMDPDTGFNQEAFTKMCNDESDIGCYCNDVELQLILNKLVAAPKKKETKKRPRGYVCRCFAKVSWFTDVNDT